MNLLLPGRINDRGDKTSLYFSNATGFRSKYLLARELTHFEVDGFEKNRSKIFIENPLEILKNRKIENFSKIGKSKKSRFSMKIFENRKIGKSKNFRKISDLENFSTSPISKWPSSLANKYFYLNPVALNAHGLDVSPLRF